MSCCGILCSCEDITKCVGCEFYEFAVEYMNDLLESIFSSDEE